MKFSALAIACTVATGISAVWAPNARGQALQLPSFDYFSVQTSVLVPDRGGAYLGGVGRSSYGSSRYGWPGLGRFYGNRSLGGAASAGGMSVHASVIDNEAPDRAVLAEAARRRGESAALDRKGAEISDKLSKTTSVAASSELMSVAEVRRQNEVRKQARQNEALELFAKGKAAETNGQTGVAKIYYQMAQRRADAELQRQIAARLNALKPADVKR